jgi:hypothetical protein
LKALLRSNQGDGEDLSDLYAYDDDSLIDVVVMVNETEGLLNSLLQEMWPQLGGFIEGILKTTVQTAIQRRLPPSLKSLGFGDLSFGETAIEIEHSLVQRVKRQTYEGERTDLKVTFGLNWDADTDITLNAVAVGLVATHVKMAGSFALYFVKCLPRLPFFSGLRLYFTDRPEVSLQLEGKTFGKRINLGWLNHILSDVIQDQLERRMVIPNVIGIQFERNDPHAWFQIRGVLPEGILTLRVLGARDLAPKDFGLQLPFGINLGQGEPSSDPYFEVALGGVRWKSATKTQTLHPTWEESEGTRDFLVHSLDEQQLQLRVFDADNLSQDDFIGEKKLAVGSLVRDHGGSYELAALGQDDPQGTVQVEASYARLRLDPEHLGVMVRDPVHAQAIGARFVLFVGVDRLHHRDPVPDTGLFGSFVCEVDAAEGLEGGPRVVRSRRVRQASAPRRVELPAPGNQSRGRQDATTPLGESIFQNVLTEVFQSPLPQVLRFTVSRGPREDREPEVLGRGEYSLARLVDSEANTEEATLRLDGHDGGLNVLLQLRLALPHDQRKSLKAASAGNRSQSFWRRWR